MSHQLVRQIIFETIKHLGISEDDFRGNTRAPKETLAREVVSYLGWRRAGVGTPAVAKLMGRTSHASVFASAHRMADKYAASPEVREMVDGIYDRAVAVVPVQIPRTAEQVYQLNATKSERSKILRVFREMARETA